MRAVLLSDLNGYGRLVLTIESIALDGGRHRMAGRPMTCQTPYDMPDPL